MAKKQKTGSVSMGDMMKKMNMKPNVENVDKAK